MNILVTFVVSFLLLPHRTLRFGNIIFVLNISGEGEREAKGACWNWWSKASCQFADADCKYWAEWTAKGNDTVEFKVMQKIANIDNTWIGIGFSKTRNMVSTHIM